MQFWANWAHVISQKETFFGKITHMCRRSGTPQNFCLAFIDELEKQLLIKKTDEVGQKKCIQEF